MDGTPKARPDLRRRRRLLGMSQGDLAHRLRVTKAAVSSWESGKRTPADRFIPDLAKALNLQPGELLTLIDSGSN